MFTAQMPKINAHMKINFRKEIKLFLGININSNAFGTYKRGKKNKQKLET